MNISRLAALLLLAACEGGEGTAKPAPEGEPKDAAPKEAEHGSPAEAGAAESELDKTLYALGLSIGGSLDPFALTEAESVHVIEGLKDALAKREPKVDIMTYGPKIDALVQERAEKAAGAARERAGSFLAELAATPGATKAESGLIYIETQAGTGKSPVAADTVRVHYRGTLADGKEFDSSYARNEPAEFPLGNVIPCWTEGLQKMKIGGKAKLGCPAELAYGERGVPGIPGGSALLFEVELLAIQ